YQNRNDAAFGLTAGSANSITRSIAKRRSDCARRGARESDARSRRLEWKSGFREADSNFYRCGSRVVADHSHPTCILASRRDNLVQTTGGDQPVKAVRFGLHE